MLFTGPVLLLVTMIFEWIMGNFFPMIICGLFGVFYLSIGVVQLPSWQIVASYSPTGNVLEGTVSVGYNAALALYMAVWGMTIFTFFVFTLGTNVVFAGICLFLDLTAFLISAAYFKASIGQFTTAMKIQKVRLNIPLLITQAAGAMLFVAAVFGWYRLQIREI